MHRDPVTGRGFRDPTRGRRTEVPDPLLAGDLRALLAAVDGLRALPWVRAGSAGTGAARCPCGRSDRTGPPNCKGARSGGGGRRPCGRPLALAEAAPSSGSATLAQHPCARGPRPVSSSAISKSASLRLARTCPQYHWQVALFCNCMTCSVARTAVTA